MPVTAVALLDVDTAVASAMIASITCTGAWAPLSGMQ
jgi:hypothetical protein